MKSAAPTNSSTSQVNSRFSHFPIIGSVVGFFFANRRLQEAQQEVRESAPVCQRVIESADKTIAAGAKNIEAAKAAIKETDAEIAESRAQHHR